MALCILILFYKIFSWYTGSVQSLSGSINKSALRQQIAFLPDGQILLIVTECASMLFSVVLVIGCSMSWGMTGRTVGLFTEKIMLG